MVDYQRVFNDFRKEIIQDRNDSRNLRWKGIVSELQKDVGNVKFKLLDPKVYIPKVFKSPDCNITQLLDSLENAFYCLSPYAINICDHPIKGEYGLLKTYTGYFTSNIASVMRGSEQHILELMGYQVKPECENADEFILTSHVNQIEELTFELFLSQLYYRKMRLLCEEAINNGYSNDVVLQMMLDRGMAKIESLGVCNTCDIIKHEQDVIRTHEQTHYHREIKYDIQQLHSNIETQAMTQNMYEYRPGNQLVANLDEVDDDDLYDEPDNVTNQPPDNNVESKTMNRIQNIQYRTLDSGYPLTGEIVINDAMFDSMRLDDPKPKTIGSVRDTNMKPPYPNEYQIDRRISALGADAMPGYAINHFDNSDIASRTRSKHRDQVNSNENAHITQSRDPRTNGLALAENVRSTITPHQNQYEMSYPESYKSDLVNKVNQAKEKQKSETVQGQANQSSFEGHPNPHECNKHELLSQMKQVGQINKATGGPMHCYTEEEIQQYKEKLKRNMDACGNREVESKYELVDNEIRKEALNSTPGINLQHQTKLTGQIKTDVGVSKIPLATEKLGDDSGTSRTMYNKEYIGIDGNKNIDGAKQGDRIANCDNYNKDSTSPRSRRRAKGAVNKLFHEQIHKTRILPNKHDFGSSTFYTGADASDEYVDMVPDSVNVLSKGTSDIDDSGTYELINLPQSENVEWKSNPRMPRVQGGSSNLTMRPDDINVHRSHSGKNTPNDETTITFPPSYDSDNRSMKIPDLYSNN